MRSATASAELAQQARKSAPAGSRRWWLVHQWVGLKLSLFLTFILFTGTLAVLSHEIDWLLQPSLRVPPSSAQGPVAWATIADNAAARPEVASVSVIEAPVASAFAARVSIRYRHGGPGYLYAHPISGQIQGHGPWIGAHRVLRNMHRHLNLPVKIGVPIVCSLAVLLLVTLVTSFLIYKKWWRGFSKLPRKRNARTWWGDFHRLAGVWSLWFIALMIVTSLWYLVENLGLQAPPQPQAETVDVMPMQPPSDLAEAFAAAQRAYPGLKLRRVILPNGKRPLLRLFGDYEAILVRPRSNAVWVDPTTAKVVLTTDGRDLSLHQRISEMADPLHFGNFAGYWSKVPWFLFGLLMTALSLSGTAIYSLRLSRKRDEKIRLATGFDGMWRGMGRWRWLSVALLCVGFALLLAMILAS